MNLPFLWYVVFFLPVAASAAHVWAALRLGRDEPRSGVTGCEVARSILDACGETSAAVAMGEEDPACPRAQPASLYLPRALYAGTTSYELALAAMEATRFVLPREHLVTRDLRNRLWEILWGLLWAVWACFLLAWFGPAPYFFRPLAAALFALYGAAGIWEAAEAWGVSRAALRELWRTGYFEIDELVKLGRLLFVLRFRRLAVLCEMPFRWISVRRMASIPSWR